MKVFSLFITFIFLTACGGSDNSGTKKTLVNSPPIITVITQHIAISGEELTLSADIVDPEKHDITVKWNVIQGIGFTLNNSSSSEVKFITPLTTIDSEIIINIIATDSEGLSTSKNITVNVPAASISLTSEDNFIIGESSLVNAVTKNIKLDNFTSSWMLNGEPINFSDSAKPLQLRYTPNLKDINQELNFELIIKDLNKNKLENSLKVKVPEVEVSFNSTDNFQVLKTSYIEVIAKNINLEKFVTQWQINTLPTTPVNPLLLTYTPDLIEHGSDITFNFIISDNQNQKIEKSVNIKVPEVKANFQLPIEPISLRYIFVNAQFENLDINDINIQWQNSNAQDLNLENSNTPNLKFYAKKELAIHNDFDTTQEIALSVEVATPTQSLSFPTIVTIGPVDNVPQWPIHEISETTQPQAKKSSNSIKIQASEQQKHLDLNNDGLSDYLSYENGTVYYHQAIDESIYQPPIEVISDVDISFSDGKILDTDNNENPELYVIDKYNQDDTKSMFSRLFFDASIKKVIYEEISLLKTPYSGFSEYRGGVFFDIEKQKEKLLFLYSYHNKNVTYSPRYWVDYYSSELIEFEISNQALINAHSLFYDNNSYESGAAFYSFDSIEFSDINEDGIDEIMLFGTYKFNDIFGEPMFSSHIAIQDGTKQSGFVTFGNGSFRQKDIDNDANLEWIYNPDYGTENNNDCDQLYHINLVENKVITNTYGHCPTKTSIFSNLSTQINFFPLKDSNELSYLNVYTECWENYGLRQFCGTEYVTGHYLTLENIGEYQTNILLTKELRIDGKNKLLTPSEKYPIELVDYDSDGDLDITFKSSSTKSYWIENIESMPIQIKK
ncbi:hypothetical protein [Pseudoalteromonas denitrificans]|uniref:Repeat domain-containing protein n=1 Tax=Pseudoalteromonas denitrificans DSM 6059 TaxID=1123010 RepID=A0A1I1SIW7_9GAMM|nr:hypothetical protein [Pseudoalteromonas denitrificans]SFD44598.1 hypothetical protein SAMN02745724_04549 [Pseudoalteromonas denitrificans DSM 6059]